MKKIKKEKSLNVAIRSLVTNECANYFSRSDDIVNYCCLEVKDNNFQCIYFIENENKKCIYFENNVLPLSPQLQLLYETQNNVGRELTSFERKEIKKNAEWANKVRKKCEMCGNIFPAQSNRQKYCDNCSKTIKRDQARLRMQNKKLKDREKVR